MTIIAGALFLAFNKGLRDGLLNIQKIAVGFTKDFITTPTLKILHLDAFTLSKPLLRQNSALKSRLDKYLSSGDSHQQSEHDIWKRHEDKTQTAIVSALREFSSARPQTPVVKNGHNGIQHDGDVEMDGSDEKGIREMENGRLS